MPEGTEGQGEPQGGEQNGQQQEPQGGQQEQQQAPPWEREGQQFDPERAWNLIQSLRGERDELRGERETLQGRVSEFEQQSMSEQERLTHRATTAEQQAQSTAAELTQIRVALTHGFVTRNEDGTYSLDGDAIDLLGTGTEEELTARAARIAALRTPQQQEAGPASFDGGPRTPTAPPQDMNTFLRKATGRA